jgi:hypothetical protein
MLPSERLLEILKQSFSYSYLNDIEKTLAELPPLSPNQRVAVYVVRRTCVQLCGLLDGVEPTVERHRAIEKHVSRPLESVVRSIAKFKDVSFEQLASLIQGSEAARILA